MFLDNLMIPNPFYKGGNTKIMTTDLASGTLLGLSIVSGSVSVDLLMKQLYWVGLAFLVVTAVFVFAREYFKVQ